MAKFKQFTCAELTRRLREEFPEGEVFKGWKNRYCVKYKEDGRIYTYNSESLYTLALRLNLATDEEVSAMRNPS